MIWSAISLRLILLLPWLGEGTWRLDHGEGKLKAGRRSARRLGLMPSTLGWGQSRTVIMNSFAAVREMPFIEQRLAALH